MGKKKGGFIKIFRYFLGVGGGGGGGKRNDILNSTQGG